MKQKIKDYYSLTKPGLVYGNLISTIGGFLLASRGNINLTHLVTTLIGISLIMASGCVLNCYIDVDIDRLMKRTQNRALVRGVVSKSGAVVFALFLFVFGTLDLLIFTNKLVVVVALVGYFVYVVLYTMWLKRTSIHSTLVGSIAGATPIVVGYVSVSHSFDTGAQLLFIIMAIWQMPHSYALYIGFLDDYTRASINTLPVVKGIYWTKLNIVFYVIAFFLATMLLSIFRYTGYIYLCLMPILSAVWVILAYKGLKAKNLKKWSRGIFFYSILVVVIFSLLISFDWRIWLI